MEETQVSSQVIKKEKPKWVMVVAGIAIGAIVAVLCMVGYTSAIASSAAVMVNGEVVSESEVTDYVQNARKVQGLDSDDAWKEYLEQYDMTPADARSSAVQSLENQVIIRQVAKELGVTVNTDEVNEEIESVKSSVGNDEEWQEYLTQNNMDEQEYRNHLELSNLTSGIKDKLAEEIVIEDADILDSINSQYTTDSDVKHFYVLQYSTQDESAVAEVEKLKNGEITFEDLATNVLGSMDNADYGWQDMSYVSESLLNNADVTLEKNVPSEPVMNDSGTTGTVVMYTDEFVTDGNIPSIDNLPESAVTYFRENLTSTKLDSVYNNYMNNFVNHSTITTYAMPSGLVYDIQ